jgi:hypothetical protein
MKMRLLAALLLSVHVCALSARAGERTFTDFTLDLPESCSAEEAAGAGGGAGETVLTVTCHNSTFFSVSFSSSPLTGRAAAEEFARRYQGSTPMLNDQGNYFFDAERNGLSARVEIIERDNLLLIYICDNNPDGWPEAQSAAFDSITGNTPVTDEFVKKYLVGLPD